MRKILVVDDDPDLVALIQVFLKDQYRIVVAKDGGSALAMVRQEKPELILTDVLMPKVSGYDFHQNLKKFRQEIGEIPVIVMSSRSSMQSYFDDWAIAAFLGKPFKKEDLHAVIEQVFAQQEREAFLKFRPKSKKAPLPEASAAPIPSVISTKGKKLALIASVDEGVVNALKKFLALKGFTVEVALTEEEMSELAFKIKPDIIICQYWEDSEVFDTSVVCGKLSESEVTRKIPFVPICIPALAMEASKIFGRDDIVVFDTLKELRSKLELYL